MKLMYGKRKKGQTMIEVICSTVFIGIISIVICSAFIQSINLKSSIESYMKNKVEEKNLKMYMENNICRGIEPIKISDSGLSIKKKGKTLKLYLKNDNLKVNYIDDYGRKLYETNLMVNVERFNVYEKEEMIYVLMNIKGKEIVWGFLK